MLGDKILLLEIDPLVEEGIKVVIEEIITIGTITGQIIEIDQETDGTTTVQVIGVVITHNTTEEVIQDSTTDKTPNGLLETEVKVEVEMKTMVTIILEVEVEIEIKGDEKNPGLDIIQWQVQIEIACSTIDVENMIILHLNALIPQQRRDRL